MINYIKKLIFKFWYFFFPQTMIREINSKLIEGLQDDDGKRKELMYEILDYIKNEYKIDTKSKFIPFKLKLRIVTDIRAKYKDEMKENRLKMTNDLQFKTR